MSWYVTAGILLGILLSALFGLVVVVVRMEEQKDGRKTSRRS